SIQPSKSYSKIDFPLKKDIFEGNYTYTVSFELDSEVLEAIHIKEIKVSYLGKQIDAFSNNFIINYQKIFTKDQLDITRACSHNAESANRRRRDTRRNG
ncbi:MAG: hypothetical protein LBO80_09455, partial [Treponema sp.]|nr:hypothetical protein [Treponema sp.]